MKQNPLLPLKEGFGQEVKRSLPLKPLYYYENNVKKFLSIEDRLAAYKRINVLNRNNKSIK